MAPTPISPAIKEAARNFVEFHVTALPWFLTQGLVYAVDDQGLHAALVGSGQYAFESLDPERCEYHNMGVVAVATYLNDRALALIDQIEALAPDPIPIDDATIAPPNFFFSVPIADLFKEKP